MDTVQGQSTSQPHASSLGGPIFIVGPSRSGTSLLRVALSNHPAVWITRETHYFDDLRVRLGDPQAPLGPEQQAMCEKYFLRIGYRPYGAEAASSDNPVELGELRSLAQELGNSADGYFQAFCKLRARANGKAIWGEKTPRHVFQIDALFSFSEQSKVICLVRDPRAVVASYRDWHASRAQGAGDDAFRLDQERARRSFHLGLSALLWRSAMRAAGTACVRYSHEKVFFLHYEELLRDPRSVLEDLCTWLGLSFRDSMLDVPIVQSSYASDESGISQAPLERWRRKLSRKDVAVVQSFVGQTMQEFGYAREHLPGTRSAIVVAWITLPFAALRAGIANRRRLGSAPSYVWRRLRLSLP